MREVFRKLVHILFGLAIAVMVLLVDRTVAISVLVLGLFFGVILVDLIHRGCHIPIFSALVAYADRGDCLPGKGALYFAVGALTIVILFPVQAAVPALVTVAVLDGVATMVGVRYGQHRIANGKSLEGSAAAILITALFLFPFLTIPGVVIVAVLAGLIELLSPIDDNLVIPVAVSLLLTLVPALILATG
ncbi:diacylglycerol/polyprenol kinase family protein [Methanoregula sp.]|uniref:diacylglycerol/polyprenol kinase family protein n=1 Tax=Methanoregula sp. TaxID=2052170 RepID=UPI003566B33B